jgi:hypothetical protein
MSYENREFIIFNVSELDKVNFSEVLETSVNTLRKSSNKTKTFVKWEGNEPSFVSTLTTKEGPYTYTQMIGVLNTNEWSAQETP